MSPSSRRPKSSSKHFPHKKSPSGKKTADSGFFSSPSPVPVSPLITPPLTSEEAGWPGEIIPEHSSLAPSSSPTTCDAAASDSAPAKKKLSDAEDLELEAFCQENPHHELTFSSFCAAHQSLDIHLRLPLSSEECRRGGKRSLDYTVCVKKNCPGGVMVEKVPRRCEVSWRRGALWGEELVLRSLGDVDTQGKCGDVIVVLYPVSNPH